MTSTLRVNSGATWRGPIADGNLRVKANGVWVGPQYCRIKSGGAWRDTGYVGPPNPPGDPYVYAWDYSNVQAAWNYASGGPPISYYEVQLLYSDGSFWTSENSTDNISPQWGIGQDTRAQIRVRSVGNNGLTSAWSNLLRVGTGHAETYNYGYVQRTRDWSTGGSIGYAGQFNNLAGWGVPSSVLVTAIHWQIWSTDGVPMSVWPPAYVNGGNRHVNIQLNESYVWERPNWPPSIDGWDGVNFPGGLTYWGNGGRSGFVMRNTNEDSGETGNPWAGVRIDGYVTIYGTEYYNNYEIVSTNPAAGNYYW
jgi:hypothetical protein